MMNPTDQQNDRIPKTETPQQGRASIEAEQEPRRGSQQYETMQKPSTDPSVDRSGKGDSSSVNSSKKETLN